MALPSFLGRWLQRRPVVRQYEQTDCGAAALLSVLRFHGGNSSLARVRELANTGARGASLLDIVGAATALGFRASGAEGSYEDLRQVPLPCIAHLVVDGTLQHFVVVYAIDERSVTIGDPARGLRVIGRHLFESQWQTRAVALLEPTSALSATPAPSWWRWLYSYAAAEQTWLAQAAFIGVVYTAVGLFTSIFVQWLIDGFIPAANVEMIAAIGALLLVLHVIRAGAGNLRQRFLLELSRRVVSRVTTDFLVHIFRLPLRFFERRKTGDITARLNDAVRIQRALVVLVGSSAID